MGRTWKKRPETRAKVRRKVEYLRRVQQRRKNASARPSTSASRHEYRD